MRSTSNADSEEAAALLTAAAVRERCEIVFAAAERSETPHFRVISDHLDEAVERVVAVTRRRYPDLTVPYHSRWRHFSGGGVDRAALIAPGAGRTETTRAQIDLAIVSVLLDAGDAIVGDLIRGGFASGRIRPGHPLRHFFTEDRPANRAAVQLVLDHNPARIYVGHGGPLIATDVQRRLDAIT